MLDRKDILETINMIRDENLDIRTVTVGISLFDCVSDDKNRFLTNMYDKITRTAEKLVPVANELEKMYGIPIINKRVAVTPLSLVGGRFDSDGYVEAAKMLDKAADTLGINFIGGFGALVHKGSTKCEDALIDAIPEALASTKMVCSSVNVATTKAGINMDAIAKMGGIIKKTAYLTRDNNSIGCAKLVVFANVPEDNPFMAGAMTVEEGLLTGFDNAEIKGFADGAVFMPMIGSIPFVGYVFDLAADADVDAFKATLEANANPRWQICVTADETIIENVGNTVFFLMCPASLGE